MRSLERLKLLVNVHKFFIIGKCLQNKDRLNQINLVDSFTIQLQKYKYCSNFIFLTVTWLPQGQLWATVKGVTLLHPIVSEIDVS